MTFAVIKTGGKQYKVAANDVLKIEKLNAEEGTIVTFDQVLMVGNGADVVVGTPLVDGALVAAEFVETKKQKTIIILKKQRRQHFDRRNGHRQLLSTVRITEILTGGAKPTIAASAKKAPKAETVTEVEAAPKPKKAKKIEAETPVEEKVEAKAQEPGETKDVESKEKSPKKGAAKKPAADFDDDLKLIGGVGAAIEKKLVAAGITSLKDIAAWKKADVAKFDEELEFHGRIERDEWVAQAKDLIAGKPPRAKVDQDAAAEKAEKSDDKSKK